MKKKELLPRAILTRKTRKIYIYFHYWLKIIQVNRLLLTVAIEIHRWKAQEIKVINVRKCHFIKPKCWVNIGIMKKKRATATLYKFNRKKFTVYRTKDLKYQKINAFSWCKVFEVEFPIDIHEVLIISYQTF